MISVCLFQPFLLNHFARSSALKVLMSVCFTSTLFCGRHLTRLRHDMMNETHVTAVWWLPYLPTLCHALLSFDTIWGYLSHFSLFFLYFKWLKEIGILIYNCIIFWLMTVYLYIWLTSSSVYSFFQSWWANFFNWLEVRALAWNMASSYPCHVTTALHRYCRCSDSFYVAVFSLWNNNKKMCFVFVFEFCL